jgi:hypothetical protein
MQEQPVDNEDTALRGNLPRQVQGLLLGDVVDGVTISSGPSTGEGVKNVRPPTPGSDSCRARTLPQNPVPAGSGCPGRGEIRQPTHARQDGPDRSGSWPNGWQTSSFRNQTLHQLPPAYTLPAETWEQRRQSSREGDGRRMLSSPRTIYRFSQGGRQTLRETPPVPMPRSVS